ncbi:MAG: hypothetical protein R3C52_02250 [Hyphomonadaceae bacterium]
MAYADILLEVPEMGLTKDAAADEFYRVGLVYAEGLGVPADHVAAHKWFNLAASRGHIDARICREEMADMMESDQIRTAQRAAREWLKKAN